MMAHNVLEQSRSTQHVVLLRRWPSTAWLATWAHQDTTIILSEQALLAVCETPALLEQLPRPPYVLQREVDLLEIESVPAAVIQVGDARWVELTLDANNYQVLDDGGLS